MVHCWSLDGALHRIDIANRICHCLIALPLLHRITLLALLGTEHCFSNSNPHMASTSVPTVCAPTNKPLVRSAQYGHIRIKSSLLLANVHTQTLVPTSDAK